MVDRVEDGAEGPRLVAGAEHPSSALVTTESTISAAKAR
jgi:hypothetical protein